MARIRTIKPSFWKHEELSELPEATHLLAAAILNYADDYGFFNANPKLIKAECSPLREPSVSIPESLQSLSAIGYLRLGTGSDGKRYGQIVGFDKHQKVSHKGQSKSTDITVTWDGELTPPENSGKPPEPLRPDKEEEKEGKRKGSRTRASAREPRSRSGKKSTPSEPIAQAPAEPSEPEAMPPEGEEPPFPADVFADAPPIEGPPIDEEAIARAEADVAAGVPAPGHRPSLAEQSAVVSIPPPKDPGARIIWQFDQAIIEIFGPNLARPFPRATDLTAARRWLAMGLDEQLAGAIFREKLQARREGGLQPIGSLSYFDTFIPEILSNPEKKKAVLAAAKPSSRSSHTAKIIARHAGRSA